MVTKIELATAIVNTDGRKTWDEYLKQQEIRKLMRHNSKDELISLYEYIRDKYRKKEAR